MFTDDQMKALFTGVMDQMVHAQWLHSYMLTDGKGYHLTWTEPGTQRALLLKRIAESHRLTSDDRAPLAFDAVVHGTPLPAAVAFKGEMDKDVAAFWRECIAQLQLPRDQDNLLALVQIVIAWALDSDTPVRFGP